MANLGKYKINETKVSSVMASNGLELSVDEKMGTVTVKLGGALIAKDMGIGALVQASKMLQRISPGVKFVCDVHGQYMRKDGMAQQPTCPTCLSEAIQSAAGNVITGRTEDGEDA